MKPLAVPRRRLRGLLTRPFSLGRASSAKSFAVKKGNPPTVWRSSLMTGSPAVPPLLPRARNAPPRAIVLTSHPPPAGRLVPLRWGAPDPAERGPLVATLHDPDVRNVIGTHAGAYALYRALAVAAGRLAPGHRPDLTDTTPAAHIGPYPQWGDPERIVSLDPWGHLASEVFAHRIIAGWDIRPTIA